MEAYYGLCIYLQVMAGWQGLQAILDFWDDSFLGLGASLLYPGPPNTTMALPRWKALPVLLKNCIIQDDTNKRDVSPTVASPVWAHRAVSRWTKEVRSQAVSGLRAEL